MIDAFTHYWTNETVAAHQASGFEGIPLVHTAGNLFEPRGVKAGDKVFVVTVRQGDLFLIGRMVVDRVVATLDAIAQIFFSDSGSENQTNY